MINHPWKSKVISTANGIYLLHEIKPLAGKDGSVGKTLAAKPEDLSFTPATNTETVEGTDPYKMSSDVHTHTHKYTHVIIFFLKKQFQKAK